MASSKQNFLSISLEDEAAMVSLGQRLVSVLPKRLLISLSGELGAGKSVLARSMIQALGVTGRIKSPTYTLLETYHVPKRRIAHLDLYRLEDPDELHYLGFDDVLAEHELILIEWPQKAGRQLAQVGSSMPHWEIGIHYSENGRVVDVAGLEALPN